MKKIFIVVSDSIKWTNNDIDSGYLRSRKLYKTLSLLLSSRAGVQVPPTLLMLDMKTEALNTAIQHFGLPLMIRMDYQSLPSQKALGGIPIYTLKETIEISKFLFRANCYPMFHPHLDRFADVYSAGVLLNNQDFEADFEVVGRGFDAGDLRLGDASPHESFKVSLFDDSIRDRSTISNRSYQQARSDRKKRMLKLMQYTKYVNKFGVLLPSLNDFEPISIDHSAERTEIPKEYVPMTRPIMRSLTKVAYTIRLEVINSLPFSDGYVASLSFLPKHGWTLWDVYGGWYKR